VSFHELSNTKVIAFGHRARHGKDFAAGVVAQAFPYAQRFGFADALKAVCRVQWGMRAKDADLLQKVGVAMRSIDPDIWLRALYWTIAERQPRIALITDLRFPNEMDLVKAMNGLAIKVERRDAVGNLFVPADRDPNHISEIALADDHRWDAVIVNPEGQVDVFRSRVLSTVEQFIGSRPSGFEGLHYGEQKAAA